jgi:hypothetical protein
VFANFPKSRPALPPEYLAIYAEQYKQNREGASAASDLAQKMESWMHRQVAADQAADKWTLEIGAGTLNHLPYEPDAALYDIVEPFEFLFETSPAKDRVANFYSDISAISTGTEYDRIISIATFEHICELPAVVARCGTLLSPGGNLRVGIPSEGTILWKLGYKLTTGLEFRRKYGLDYEVLMRHEHVNTASEIEAVLRYFFSKIQRKVFGLIPALSLYQFFKCSGAHLERCEEYLSTLTSAD